MGMAPSQSFHVQSENFLQYFTAIEKALPTEDAKASNLAEDLLCSEYRFLKPHVDIYRQKIQETRDEINEWKAITPSGKESFFSKNLENERKKLRKQGKIWSAVCKILVLSSVILFGGFLVALACTPALGARWKISSEGSAMIALSMCGGMISSFGAGRYSVKLNTDTKKSYLAQRELLSEDFLHFAKNEIETDGYLLSPDRLSNKKLQKIYSVYKVAHKNLPPCPQAYLRNDG